MQENETALAPLLRRLMSRAELDENDQAAILSLPYTLRILSAGKHVVREGDKPTHSCLILSGFCIRYKVVADGARQILAINMKGDAVDLQNSFLATADHDVQTLTAAEMAFIPREALQQIMLSRPSVGSAILLETLVDGSIFREWIANVGRRDARQRIAHLLCEFALRLEAAGLGEACNYELPMTQEQIADTVGLTAVHVNRTLMALDGEGLTNRTKRSVQIPDWKKLASVGDFNSLYLHLPESHSRPAH